jgi:hypothetical protein
LQKDQGTLPQFDILTVQTTGWLSHLNPSLSPGTDRCYASGMKLFAVTDSAEKRGPTFCWQHFFTALRDIASSNKKVIRDTFGNGTKWQIYRKKDVPDHGRSRKTIIIRNKPEMCGGFFAARQSQLSLGHIFFRFRDDSNMSHTSGRTPLSEWPVRRRCRYPHNTQQTQEKSFHAFSKMRTHDPRSHGTADLRLRPHGHRDRLCGGLETVSQVSANMYTREPCCAREFENNSIHHAFIVNDRRTVGDIRSTQQYFCSVPRSSKRKNSLLVPY